MDTLKQLQEKMSEEFEKEYIKSYEEYSSYPMQDILDFLHQQITLAYNAGKAEATQSIKEILGDVVEMEKEKMFTKLKHLSQSGSIKRRGYNLAKRDTLNHLEEVINKLK